MATVLKALAVKICIKFRELVQKLLLIWYSDPFLCLKLLVIATFLVLYQKN